MFVVGIKVRCKIKGRQGGVVLWSNSKETGILVGSKEDVYTNDQLEAFDSFTPKFIKGQLVCHIYQKSLQAYVVKCGQDYTTLMTKTAVGLERLEVMQNCFLKPVKSKKKKREGKRGSSGILNSMLETGLVLPAIFVDATMGKGERDPRIVAVIIGVYGKQLYHAIEAISCNSINAAEYEAIKLGIELRTNEDWPLYSDSLGQANKYPAPNVVWIPREKNRIADRLLRCAVG